MACQRDPVTSLLCCKAYPGGHVSWRVLQPLPGYPTQERGAVGALAPGPVVMPAGVARDECYAPCRKGPAKSHVHGLVKVAPASVDPDDRDWPSARDKRADQRAIEPNPIFGVGAYEALPVGITHGLRSSMPG